MLEVIITGGVGIVSTIVSGWVSWIFARRKYNSEVDGTCIDNMQKALTFYGTLSEDNKQRLAMVLDDNTLLRKSVDDLLDENKLLKRLLDNLKDQVLKLTTSICTDLSCQIRKHDFTTLNIISDEKSNSELNV